MGMNQFDIDRTNKHKQERLGEEKINSYGLKMKIVEYNDSANIIVEFEDGRRKRTRYSDFKKGCVGYDYYVKPSEKAANRIGEVKENKYGEIIKIIEYNNSHDILVKFQDETLIRSTYEKFKNGTITTRKRVSKEKEKERIGEERINSQGLKMQLIEYRTSEDITVKFENGEIKITNYYKFNHGHTRSDIHIQNRIKEIYDMRVKNYQGYEMRIVQYDTSKHIIVEFNDKYKTRIETDLARFKKGTNRNPSHAGKYGQVTGNKYPTKINGKHIKEYQMWRSILNRVFEPNKSLKNKTYEKVSICDDWLYYPNFYEWVHKQPNYIKWLNNSEWCIDKDIFSDPNNKMYSPNTCCLVPRYINSIVQKWNKENGVNSDLPLGVIHNGNGYSTISLSGKTYFNSLEEAFNAYKEYKVKKIKDAAELAYSNGDITKECYEALLNYDYFKNLRKTHKLLGDKYAVHRQR